MAADFMSRFAAAIGRPSDAIDRSIMLTDLEIDSFELVNVLVRLQEDLDVRIFQEDLQGVKTIGDLESVFQRRQ
ncbi:MAG TPA: acyl carrier protein [Thermoanaerobaculia bacterium]|jgi:acyl carrier protein